MLSVLPFFLTLLKWDEHKSAGVKVKKRITNGKVTKEVFNVSVKSNN